MPYMVFMEIKAAPTHVALAIIFILENGFPLHFPHKAIILSFSPKFAEVIGSLPSSIIGGVSFILYGMISAIGVRNVVENHVDFTKSRNLIIAAVILVSGLGFSNGLTFTIGGASITLTSLAIAAILGIVLNAILPGKDYEGTSAKQQTE